MQKKEYSVEFGGKTLTAEFNDLADQTNGSVIIRYGNTVVFASAVMSKKPKDGDFFPLTVDYEEKFYAAGRILGGQFTRREGRPSDEAILSGRAVDRTIRPLFDHRMRHDVQVVLMVLSIDEDDPDVLAVLAASLALGVSDIPWNGPASAVRIGRRKGEANLIINPIYTDREGADLDLVACGKDGNINMIEVGSKEVPNQIVMEALRLASAEIEKIQNFQKKIITERGKKKLIVEFPVFEEKAADLFAEKIEPRLEAAVFSGPGKKEANALKDEWLLLYNETFPEGKVSLADEYFEEKVNDLIHREAVEKSRRPDGRGLDEIRPLYVQAGGLSPMLHGSGIFYRGGTHVLSALTLGGPGDSQTIDGMELQTEKRFLHHYNFPPFSTGETGRMGGLNRRMIGHGNLAEKALTAVIPDKEKFPYTIRLVSESMASNGSTSMGSVCASTLALMDGGVPIKAPVAGIASGLMMKDEKNYVLLTDIQGPEDHHGDMDFKVAGTREGVTAVQMDVKVDGIPLDILEKAFEKAEKARLQILDQIEKEIPAPRLDISSKAPKIISIRIKPDQIGLVIGGGGKTIKDIKEKTGAEIDIEDDGTVYLTGKEGSAEKAKSIIEEMTHEYKAGERFEGTVIKIMDFGAFVKIGSSTEGLVHISEIAPFRVENVSKVLKEGQKVPIVVKEVDERGRINLSIKRADPDFIKNPASSS
ncbi:MAG TPA: polyribonucleotide nucleotidyltransferase [Candidatus Paceibacterota bacterium]|nr:polyribonucleotide nucleotidyltransferase [Candidatus Paceibacterota bacterium]